MYLVASIVPAGMVALMIWFIEMLMYIILKFSRPVVIPCATDKNASNLID